jgi:PAS domain S-box-containing protein
MDPNSRFRAELAAIVESSDDAIIGKSLGGIVTSWNTGAYRLFGYTETEMVGQPISRLIPTQLLPEEADILARLKAGEHIEHLETTRVRKDGTHIDVSVTVSPIRDDSGALIGASKVARDITDRKRTAEILRKTTLELKRSNRDLEQFAYVASHDLQEPLRAVVGCVKLLGRHLHGRADLRTDELMLHALEGAMRMQTLIVDLLTYSRMGKDYDPMTTVDCGAALDRAIANLSTAILDSGVEVTRDSMPRVQAIPALLTILFQNLIANALKFRRGDEPGRIHIGAQFRSGEWVISVSDNGIGIEPDSTGRIFELFQRLHTHDEYPGTGIGLAVCKRIVELHGGVISVESSVGSGSVFTFTLPNSELGILDIPGAVEIPDSPRAQTSPADRQVSTRRHA